MPRARNIYVAIQYVEHHFVHVSQTTSVPETDPLGPLPAGWGKFYFLTEHAVLQVLAIDC